MATENLNCPHCSVKFPKFFTNTSGVRKSGLKTLTDHIRMVHPQAVESAARKEMILEQLEDRENDPRWRIP